MTTEAQWLVIAGLAYIVGVFTGVMVNGILEMRASSRAIDQLLKRGKRDLEQAHTLLSELRMGNGHG